MFLFSVPKVLKIFSANRKKEIIQKHGIEQKEIPNEKLKKVTSINSKESIAFIKAFRADVIIINGTRIISKKVLSAVETKFINTHLGITPKYRGVHGGYWALANNDLNNFGATIHFVDEGVDTGGVLKQVTVMPDKKDNYLTYPLLQLSAVLPSLKNTIELVLTDSIREQEIKNMSSNLWSHPTLFQYLKNYLALGVK